MNKKILKDTLALVLITLVAVILLAVVYEITKEPIEEAVRNEIRESFEVVFEGGVIEEEADGFETVEIRKDGRTTNILDCRKVSDKNGNRIGNVMSVSGYGFGGEVVFSIGVGNDGVIVGLTVTSAGSESPGLGANCLEKDFGERYVGKSFGVELTKTGEEGKVDAISSATITSDAILNAVNDSLEYLIGKGEIVK